MADVTYLEAIRQALSEEMERVGRVFLLGEDIGAYGGAFKVTAGLHERFGPERVIDTPIAEAGIDLLHPLEPLARMDPGRVHRRYPHLILCGTIDVSQLLPYGTPQQIADQVARNVEATEGQIMVGSSTEVHDGVPLENYLALHEAVLGYAY